MTSPGQGFLPSHRVPAEGLACWAEPGAPRPLAVRLDPRLDVRLVAQRGGWAQVECSNGWTTWVDGARLLPLGATAAFSPHPLPLPASPLPVMPPPPPPPRASRTRRAPSNARSRVLLSLLGLVVAAAGVAVPLLSHRSSTSTPPPNGPPTASTAATAGFPDPEALQATLLAPLTGSAPVAAATLAPLFGPAATDLPRALYAPPAPVAAGPVGLPTAAGAVSDYADVTVSGTVPDAFTAYVTKGILLGLAGWDRLYPDPAFNLEQASMQRHFRLLVTTDRKPFEALVNTTVFRHGYVDPCPNGPLADVAACIPEVRIFFEASRWDGRTYEPMTMERIAHEVIHVGHLRLLASLGKANLFQQAGYYWQTEGFATYTQRQLPDALVYDPLGVGGLLDQSYFAWPSLSDRNYELAYTAAPFLDEVVYQSGDDPKLMLRWLQGTTAGTSSSQSLMQTVSGLPGGAVDLTAFERGLLTAMVDLRLPGFLTGHVDPRTVQLAAYRAKTDGSVDATALPATVSSSVPVLGSRTLEVGVSALPDDRSTSLRFRLSGSGAGDIRAVLVATRGDKDDNLQFCDNVIGDGAPAVRVAAARACLGKFARVFGVVSSGQEVTLTAGALHDFSPDVSKLRIAAVVVGLATPAMLGAGTVPPPIGLTLSVEKAPPPTAAPPLSDTVTGTLTQTYTGTVAAAGADNGPPLVGAALTDVGTKTWSETLVVHVKLRRDHPGTTVGTFIDDGSTWELTGSVAGAVPDCQGVGQEKYHVTLTGTGTMTQGMRKAQPITRATAGTGYIRLEARSDSAAVILDFGAIGLYHVDVFPPGASCGRALADGGVPLYFGPLPVMTMPGRDGTCTVADTLTSPGAAVEEKLTGSLTCPVFG